LKTIITRIDRIPRPQRKVRTAAYCRVSSDRDAHIISLNNQRAHYEAIIASRTDWELAGIYCDEGLSGTSKEGRPELMRLISDCMTGRIDLVITKSISRFARNTMDCLELVRRLTANGVDIFFEKENLGTQEAGGELILSILASIAEEESRSISENEKWTIRKRFQRGTFRLSRAPYGYELVDGVIRIIPEEAAVVRYIFSSILSGQGTGAIAAELNARGIPTKRQGSWHAGTIQSMVHNVFFAGDLLMQKTWRDSRYCVRFNYGEFDQYYIEDHHPAIVSREVFTAANLTCAQRGREKNNIPNDDRRLRSDPHHNRYCFTGRIFCGKCGGTLKRQMIYRSDGSHAVWVCRMHLNDPEACPLKRILEADIRHAFVTMLNKLAFSRKMLLQPYIGSLQKPYVRSLQKPGSEGAGVGGTEVECAGVGGTGSASTPAGPASAADLNLQAQKRLILYYSKGRIEPVVFHRTMAQLKRSLADGTAPDAVHDTAPNAAAFAPPSASGEAEQRARFAAEAKALNTFLAGWKIGETAFSDETFTRFAGAVRIDSRSQITFCLKCGLALSEKIGH